MPDRTTGRSDRLDSARDSPGDLLIACQDLNLATCWPLQIRSSDVLASVGGNLAVLDSERVCGLGILYAARVSPTSLT